MKNFCICEDPENQKCFKNKEKGCNWYDPKQEIKKDYIMENILEKYEDLKAYYDELLKRYNHERTLTSKYLKLGNADERYKRALNYAIQQENEGWIPSTSDFIFEKVLKIAAYNEE